MRKKISIIISLGILISISLFLTLKSNNTIYMSLPSYLTSIDNPNKALEEIHRVLKENYIKSKVSEDGKYISVEKDKFTDSIITLSQSGVFSDHKGFVIFGNSIGLITTNNNQQNKSSEQKTIVELEKMLLKFENIQDVKILLDTINKKEPTKATIKLKLSNKKINKDFYETVILSVANNYNELNPKNITVTDETGKILATGENIEENNLNNQISDMNNEVKKTFEEDLKVKIISYLEPILGKNNLKAKVDLETNLENSNFSIKKATVFIDYKSDKQNNQINKDDLEIIIEIIVKNIIGSSERENDIVVINKKNLLKM